MEVCMNIENCDNSCFVMYDDFVSALQSDPEVTFDKEMFDKLIVKSLIVTIRKNGKLYLYKDDETICKEIFLLNYKLSKDEYIDIGYHDSFLIERIKISKDTFFCYSMEEAEKAAPVFIRNIIYFFKNKYEKCERREYDILGVKIVTYNKYVAFYIENVVYRKYRLDELKKTSFSNSSAYMGSKKNLVGFVVESMWPHVCDDSVILDIMCGSGAVSNAFAQMSDVYASDAQLFCRLLAKIQGAGFDQEKAFDILNKLHENYIKNYQSLHEECEKELNTEKAIFHMDMNDLQLVLEKYKNYIQDYQLYSSTEVTSEKVMLKIFDRKRNHALFPYCLFTYYFSNIYFGLEQCMQIDSIRYSIDSINDKEAREWALGVLVVTVSAVASNHAGHFAQPKRVDEKTILSLIEKRKKSVWLEFSKRLLAIASESERYPYEVHTVDGPWEHALKQIAEINTGDIIVYLDAPYKRDEYSRYYHVLETLVLYDYPASERKGRLRSKLNGERFRTEFFSKNTRIVEEKLEKTIIAILQISKACAWSYSDNGVAFIPNVINNVLKKISCKVYLYSIPYKHNSQRKKDTRYNKRSLDVMEYCIIFVPQKKE